MKKLSLVAAVVFISSIVMAQSKAVEDFHSKYKDDRDASVVSLNGSMFELFASIAELADDEDAQAMARIAKGINSMEILAIPMDKAGISTSEIDKLRSDIKSEDYEELMTMRDGRERVYIMAKTKDSKIDNMLVLVNGDEDEFVLMNLNGVLEMKDLAYLAEHHDKWGK